MNKLLQNAVSASSFVPPIKSQSLPPSLPPSLLVTLKNVADLAEFASAYHSAQLYRSCLQFACVNLPALLEGKMLDTLSLSSLVELSETYAELVRGWCVCVCVCVQNMR